MKTYQACAQEFGTLNLDSGEEVALIQQAYLDYCPTDGSAYYAGAKTECDKSYVVRWTITNSDAENEADSCDWTEFTALTN